MNCRGGITLADADKYDKNPDDGGDDDPWWDG